MTYFKCWFLLRHGEVKDVVMNRDNDFSLGYTEFERIQVTGQKIGKVWVGDLDFRISGNQGEEDEAGTLGTTYTEMMDRG